MNPAAISKLSISFLHVSKKITHVVLAWLICLSGPAVLAETVYGEGYQVGVLTKFSIRGLFHKWGVGRLLMGQNSSERSGIYPRNPWEFEMDAAFESQALRYIETSRPVVVQYKVYQFFNRFINENAHRAEAFLEVDPVSAPTSICSNSNARGSYSHGSIVGRIVSVRHGGVFLGTKSYEITVQEGDGGNQFKNLSVTDKGIYDCALLWLKSGLRTIVSYRQVYGRLIPVFDQKSYYDVESIGPINQ